MDIQFLRTQINTYIKLMEQGNFQQFCTDFLPLLDEKYKGLHRHGATSLGKTRKGTPDAINTLSSGEQIALEVSVDEQYWEKPKKIEQWKPISDIKKCLEKITNPSEIVLCSSQEPPTNTPNLELDIINYSKQLTKAKIAIYSLQRLETELINFISANPYHNIAQTYFPEVFNLAKEELENEKAKFLVGQYGSSYNFGDVKKIVEDVFRQAPNLDIAKELAEQKITALKQRFEIKPIPKTGEVVRDVAPNSILLNPCGKHISLIGVIRIGKTVLVQQCVENWLKRGISVRWFRCPDEKEQTNNFCFDVLKNILEVFLPSDLAVDLAINSVQLESIDWEKIPPISTGPILFVIDEAENLSSENLKKISSHLSYLAKTTSKNLLGIVFISNKSLRKAISTLDEEIASRQWTPKELTNLIAMKFNNGNERFQDAYIKHLHLLSKGHPLIALALARKYPTLKELFLSTFSKSPNVLDEDLDVEVKKFLFDDVLKDKDDLELVLRMSALVHRARVNLIEILMRKIEPAIGRTQKLIIEKLFGTVLEGDDELGYTVVEPYKTIAKSMTTKEWNENVYKVVGDELLRPKGKVINSIDITEGSYYAMLSQNQEKAFYWSSLLLKSLSESGFDKEQKKRVLDDLEILSYVVPRGNDQLFMFYVGFVMMLGLNFMGVGDYEKAFKLFERLGDPGKEVKDKKIKGIVNIFHELVAFQKLMINFEKQKPTLDAFTQIDLSKLSLFPEAIVAYLEIFDEVFKRVKLADVPDKIFQHILSKVDIKHPKVALSFLGLGLSLGAKIKNESKDFDHEIKEFKSDTLLGEVFVKIAEAEYKLELDLFKESLASLREVVQLCSKNKLFNRGIATVVDAVAGDLYYRKGLFLKAQCAYTRAKKYQKVKSFDYAWAGYRLGLLSTNATEARKYFNQAGQIFQYLQLENFVAKSLGEEAVACVQEGDYLAFANIAEKVCIKYYEEKNINYGPTAAVILGQITRLTHMLDGTKPQEEKGIVFPEFERKVHDKVLDIAKPRAGGSLGFYGVSSLYSRIGNPEGKNRNSARALNYLDKIEMKEEVGAALFIIKNFLDENIPSANLEEIRKVMWQGITLNISLLQDGRFPNPRLFASFCLFSKIDQCFSQMEKQQQLEYFALLNAIIKQIDASTIQDKEFWKSEVFLRIAGLGEKIITDKSERFNLWSNTFNLADKSGNDETVFYSGHSLSFLYGEFLETWEKLIELQLRTIKAIAKERDGVGKAQRMGEDLIKFWTKAFQKIKLNGKTDKKDYLRETLKSLSDAGVPLPDVQMLIVLLVANLVNYRGFATEYAVETLRQRGAISNIPITVLSKIREYL